MPTNHEQAVQDRIAIRRNRIRRKLLDLLPRDQLDGLSGLARPWHVNRDELIVQILQHWPHNEIAIQITKMVEKAK